MRRVVLLIPLMLSFCQPGHEFKDTARDRSIFVESVTEDNTPVRPFAIKFSSEVSHRYLGFGLSVYGQETRYLDRMLELKPAFVRLEAGPSWASLEHQVPEDPAMLKDHIATHFNEQDPGRLEKFKESFAFFKEHNIRVILIIYQQPYHWLQNDYMKTFKPGAERKLVRLWVALLEYFRSHDMQVDYVELANEPEGNWNGHIPAKRYFDMVVDARKSFDAAGFSQVRILGPGLSSLDLEGIPTRWIQSMPTRAERSIYAFSLHAWDEVLTDADNLNVMRNAWKSPKAAFRKINPEKPVFITEYAREVSRRRDAKYYSPAKSALFTASDTHEFAIQFVANTLIHINQGASAPVAWRLSDLNGDPSSWGLIRSPERGGSSRPAFEAFKFLNQHLMENAGVWKPASPIQDDTIAAVLLNREVEFVLAVANAGADYRELDIEVPSEHSGDVLWSLFSEKVPDCTEEFSDSNNSESTHRIRMPPFSIGVLRWSE